MGLCLLCLSSRGLIIEWNCTSFSLCNQAIVMGRLVKETAESNWQESNKSIYPELVPRNVAIPTHSVTGFIQDSVGWWAERQRNIFSYKEAVDFRRRKTILGFKSFFKKKSLDASSCNCIVTLLITTYKIGHLNLSPEIKLRMVAS